MTSPVVGDKTIKAAINIWHQYDIGNINVAPYYDKLLLSHLFRAGENVLYAGEETVVCFNRIYTHENIKYNENESI